MLDNRGLQIVQIPQILAGLARIRLDLFQKNPRERYLTLYQTITSPNQFPRVYSRFSSLSPWLPHGAPLISASFIARSRPLILATCLPGDDARSRSVSGPSVPMFISSSCQLRGSIHELRLQDG